MLDRLVSILPADQQAKAKAWVAWLGTVAGLLSLVVPDSPHWLTVSILVLSALGVYQAPNRGYVRPTAAQRIAPFVGEQPAAAVGNPWPRRWLTWFVVAVGWFAAMEAPAVLNDQPGDTLTETVVTHVPGEPLVAIFGGLVVWLSVHFGTRYAKKRRAATPAPVRVIPGTTLPLMSSDRLDAPNEDYDPSSKEH